MRKCFLLVIGVFIAVFSNAQQNVGIGTPTPNASAQLDVVSSSKGLLIPRMTSTNRIFIPGPANGLLVFDTTTNRLYQYQDGAWRYFVNNTFWTKSSTHNWMYNVADSVGIGTSAPTEWLDVDGNIRGRNNILAAGTITAGGTVSGGNLISSGSIGVASTSVLGGTVYANSDLNVNGNASVDGDMIINNTGATMQLRSSNVNRGFFQLAGTNVRTGTNSGNSTGNFVIRMNGDDKVTVDPTGDINIEGKITKTSATGFNNLLPLCYGTVKNGVLQRGSGNVSVSWTYYSGGSGYYGPGYYSIFCTGITNSSIILATPNVDISGGTTNYIFTAVSNYTAPGQATVHIIWHIMAASEVTQAKEDFSFVIYN